MGECGSADISYQWLEKMVQSDLVLGAYVAVALEKMAQSDPSSGVSK